MEMINIFSVHSITKKKQKKQKQKQKQKKNKPKKTKVSNFKGCIFVIHQPRGPYWEKLCPRFWISAQDRGHCISLYGRTWAGE